MKQADYVKKLQSEIETLKAEVVQLNEMLTKETKEHIEFIRYSDRYRKALERIASSKADDEMLELKYRECISWERIYEDIALEALQGQEVGG